MTRAPVQGVLRGGRWVHLPGTVAWEEHERAYLVYAARYGTGQSAQRIAERSGFGYDEITQLLGHPPTTWRPWNADQCAGKTGRTE